jgi:hypothetical protein
LKTRTILLAFVTCLVGLTLCFAADNPNMGTWKLNEAKSKFSPGAQKNTMVMYEMAGDNVKVTVDGVDAQGKPTHSEWTGKFDGKDYPLTGDATADTRSYKKVNANTMDLWNKKDGKAVTSAHVVVSADGKTRTLTMTGTNAEGKKVHATAVYDKQ